MIFFSLQMQRRFIQSKLYYKFFYSAWKETSHKPLKLAVAKTFSQSVCCWYSLLRWIFFIPCSNWKTLFLYKFIVTPRLFTTTTSVFYVRFLLNNIEIRYLLNNIVILLILRIKRSKLNLKSYFSSSKKFFKLKTSLEAWYFVKSYY